MLIHVVFSTKHRQPFISEAIESELHSYIAHILYEECYSPALIIGGDKDHIHILFALSRVWAPAKIIEIIKKRSSKWIKTKGPEFKTFQWQRGYGAFTVSRSKSWAVKEYIANQKEHHRKVSYEEEYIKFLEAHQIEYDEKHMWD